MLKTTTLFGILFIAVLSSKAQTPCSADKPINANPKMCIYDQIKPITITRGAASNSSHLYNYWIYSPMDPGTPPTVNPIAKVSSASSQFDPAPFLPTRLTAANYQFWIAEYDSTEKCLGKASQVLLIVNEVSPPSASPNTKFCQNTLTTEQLSLFDVLSGATVNWYPSNVSTAADSSHLGSLSTSNPYNISGIDTFALGSYTYLVSQTRGSCQSMKIPVSFSINPKPAPPILIANHSCEGLAFTALTATGTEAAKGGTYQWYASPALTPMLGGKSSSIYTPTTTTIAKAGVFTFYATQSSAVGCTSDAASVNYTVYSHPQAPIFANATQSMCATSNRVPTFTVTNVDSSGTIEWNANNSITGATYHPFIPSKETTIITAVQKGNGCVSDTSQATLIVIAQPVKPGVCLDQTICATTKPMAFTAQGIGTWILKWYTSLNDIGSTNYNIGQSYLPTSYAIPTDGAPDKITSYYVTQTFTSDSNHCEGIPKQVILIVKSKPLKPSFTSDSIITTCAYNSNVAPLTLNSNINSFEWFNYKTNTEITSSDGTVKGIHSNSYTPNPDSLLPNSMYKIIVREINAAGCLSDSIIGTYKITDCIDNSTIVGIAKLSVSPNPVSQLLRVKVNTALTGRGTIKLFNIYGALVYEKSVASVALVDETISVVSLPSGIYTVVIETVNGAVSELVEVVR